MQVPSILQGEWAKGEECERIAASAHNHLVKAQFNELASQWRELARITAGQLRFQKAKAPPGGLLDSIGASAED
jgi:hypothetical protein